MGVFARHSWIPSLLPEEKASMNISEVTLSETPGEVDDADDSFVHCVAGTVRHEGARSLHYHVDGKESLGVVYKEQTILWVANSTPQA